MEAFATKENTAHGEGLLVDLKGAAVRYGPNYVLRDLDFSLEKGINWAVLGPTGAGKTSFIRLLRGEIWPCPTTGGKNCRLYHSTGRVLKSPIGFREKTRLVSLEQLDTYRAQNWDFKVLDVVVSGAHDSVLPINRPSARDMDISMAALERVGQADKAGRTITSLSQGEGMKVLLARALAGQPEILFLDEAYDGLDISWRRQLLELTGELARAGTQIIYASHRAGELIEELDRAVVLENGSMIYQGSRAGLPQPSQPPRRTRTEPSKPSPVQTVQKADAPGPGPGRPLIRIRNANVFIDRQPILHDITWTLNQGNHWALLGPNGAGKSTLFKLMIGDLRPALGGEIVRFEDPKLKNLWDIRQRVSLVSAQSQVAHVRPQTGLEMVITGFRGSIGLARPPLPTELEAARACLARLGLEDLAGECVTKVSYGQVRMLLVARALVSGPEVLLLDEPNAGLDQESRLRMGDIVSRAADTGTTLVYATHYPGELPDQVRLEARIEQGRLTYQGPRISGLEQPAACGAPLAATA